MRKIYIILLVIMLSSIVLATGWFEAELPPPKVCGAGTGGRWMYINMVNTIKDNPVLWNARISASNPYVYNTLPGTIYIYTSGEVP